jgi:hypothetical protein
LVAVLGPELVEDALIEEAEELVDDALEEVAAAEDEEEEEEEEEEDGEPEAEETSTACWAPEVFKVPTVLFM